MADEYIERDMITEGAVKGDDNLFQLPLPFGVSFQDVVDNKRTSGTPTEWSLEQFLDSYLEFMKTSNFVVVGEDEPKNTHAKIWIDTAHDNQSNIG